MSDVPPYRTDLNAAELRTTRQRLQLQLRETRTWSDLLRHKAHALRATPDGPFDPVSLAQALAAGGPPRSEPLATSRHLRAVESNDVEVLLSHAREIWETVADPDDEQSSRELADAADHVADRLEHRWRDVRIQLDGTAQDLIRLLASDKAKERPHDR